MRLPAFQALARDQARVLLLREGRRALEKQQRRRRDALGKQQAERRNLARMRVRGVIAEEDYEPLFRELAAQVEATEAEIAELERRLADEAGEQARLREVRRRLPDLPGVWELMDPDERRQLLRDLTEYVVIERQGTARAELRLKVHFLPEQRLELPPGKSRAAGFHAGVAGLSPRELALLYWVGEGLTLAQVQAKWSGNGGHLYNLRRSVFRRLEVDDLEEAVALAAARIEA